MFDNLKEKLGSFRQEAEEAAEENVEEVDEADLDETEATDLGKDAESRLDEAELAETGLGVGGPEHVGKTEQSVDGPASAAGDEGGTGAVDFGSDTGDADSSGNGNDTAVEPSEVGPADDSSEDHDDEDSSEDHDDESETDADETNSTSFGRKAKSLVRGKFVIDEDDLEGPLQELELALLASDVEMGVAEEILDNIRENLIGETRTFTTSTGAVVEEALKEAIYDVISVGQFDFDERIASEEPPVVIVFTGVNGVGKTTSIAKLDKYFEDRGYSTVMANGDTYRAGANEQIREHAAARDTKLISHQQGGDPAAVLYDAVEYAEANDVDVVLCDTAGRLHTDEGLMDQLEKIGRVVGPDLTLFVDEAVAGQDAVNRAREFDEAVAIDGAVLTKADADSNGGAAISIAHVTGKPILFLGVGQGYDDIERFDPEAMVDRLLETED